MTPQYGPPSSPPPRNPPPMRSTSYIIDCMYQYTYIVPNRGAPFWFYPTRVEQGEISGYRWTGRRWTFYGFEPEIIMYLGCSPVPTLY